MCSSDLGIYTLIAERIKHLANEFEYKEHNVTCICNPVGYHNESGNGKWIEIKQIEI